MTRATILIDNPPPARRATPLPITMQLDRILHSQGFGSRRECRALVRQGRVAIDGECCADPFAEYVTGNNFRFSVDGVNWPYLPQATVVLHKPAGYECSRKPVHHPDVMRLLAPPLRTRGVQPVGRLDADTTGLLILTDDGQLNHRLTSPRQKLPKVYLARCSQALNDAMLEALRQGVQLHDEPAPIAAASAEQIEETLLRLTLLQGKYHQVKRMVAAAGNHVEKLTRVRIGGFALPTDLAPGEWRFMDPAEIAALLDPAA